MNKSALELRLKDIETQIISHEMEIESHKQKIHQKMANLNMLLGGKEEIMHWLNQCGSNAPMSLDALQKALGADSISLVHKSAKN